MCLTKQVKKDKSRYAGTGNRLDDEKKGIGFNAKWMHLITGMWRRNNSKSKTFLYQINI